MNEQEDQKCAALHHNAQTKRRIITVHKNDPRPFSF